MISDQRGIAKQIKRILPTSVFRLLTVIYNDVMSVIPFNIKYGFAGLLRKNKYPYCVIEDGDIVVQIGAPRDTLVAGRSRAIHFARMVGSGKVIVLEPDPENYKALKDFVECYGLSERVKLFQVGAWNEKTELVFLSSHTHPAANVVIDVKDISPEIEASRGYKKIKICVDTVDNILREAKLKLPRLISITTNGAERHIIDGMKKSLAQGVDYVSLASTQPNLIDFFLFSQRANMYEYVARDDRGYCFMSLSRLTNKKNFSDC